ncbi:MAG: NINE protein [Asgard group archaeon]|nr:NINE protein [Asgard group archaeon]
MSQTVYVQQSRVSPYSRTVTLLLCIFLGAFGAHHFYVGKSGTGVAILLLTLCTGLGSIWAFIDMIIILVGNFTDDMGRVVSSWDGGSQKTPVATTHTPPPPPQQPAQPVKPLTEQMEDQSFCQNCGAMIKTFEKFCRGCGEAT